MPPLRHLRPLCRLFPPFSYPATAGRRLIHFSSAADDPGGATEAAGSLSCPLKSRAILRFRGPDTVKFLQGLLTNDVRVFSAAASGSSVGGGGTAAASSCLPTPNMPLHQPAPVYSAMLTPQGRFLYDLFLYGPPRARDKFDRTGSGPGEDGPDSAVPTLFADVDGSLVDEVLSCFRKYKLRSKVEIDNVTQDLTCWQRFGDHLTNSTVEEPEAASVGWGAGVDPAGVSSAQGDNSGWHWFKDPRLKSLGFRGIFPSDVIPPLVESDKETDEGYYLLWRVQKGVAEGSTEMPKGEAIPLEYNLAGLNAISFDKGCYVGQELVARTHHRGVIRKRLLPFGLIGRRDAATKMQEVASGSDIVDSTSDKKVGRVTVAAGRHGMGLLRLEAAFKSASLAVEGREDVRVEVFRPDWWPSDWLPDLEQPKSAA